MENKRFLECLEHDYARLNEVSRAASLTAPVPSCPGWSLSDLVQHVGMVYLHKAVCMRTGESPATWPPPAALEEPPLDLLARAHDELMAEFAQHDPAERTFTWYAPDQSVGFWIRRMAQETVIHRVDAELGAGVSIATVPDDLARDGVDELLVAFVQYGSREWPEEYGDLLTHADGRAVRVETGDGAAWSVRATPKGVEIGTSDVECAAVVRGAPMPVLLWLWNRGGEEAVDITGETQLVADLRQILAASTG